MKQKYLLLIGLLFSLIIVSGVEDSRIACTTTQDCHDFYQNNIYICESIEGEKGYCQRKDCGMWQFERCEGDFTVWKNCGDEKMQQCLGCREIQIEEREFCEIIDEITGERGNCRMIGGGIGYECSGEPPLMAHGEECQVDNDCAQLEYCPDGSSYRISNCINGKCEGIMFAGGNPCFDEKRGCTPGLDCPHNNMMLYLLIGFVIIVLSIIFWLKFIGKK